MKLHYVSRTRATRPRWLLEELGLPHELVRLERTETRAPAHLARHPLGHVPVLEDGPVRIYESAAICLWLAERHGQGKLLPPAGSPERALAYQWLFFAMTELEPPLIQVSGELKKPEGSRDGAVLAAAKQRFLAAAAVVEAALAGREYLLGTFSAADVVLGSCILWGRTQKLLEGLPAVEAYAVRLKERPAWKRSVAD